MLSAMPETYDLPLQAWLTFFLFPYKAAGTLNEVNRKIKRLGSLIFRQGKCSPCVDVTVLKLYGIGGMFPAKPLQEAGILVSLTARP